MLNNCNVEKFKVTLAKNLHQPPLVKKILLVPFRLAGH